MNAGAFAASALSYIPSRFAKPAPYPEATGQLRSQPDARYINDASVNFFARALLQFGYDFLIEIGAYTADRSETLAQLFPKAKIYALDVTADFMIVRKEGNVTLAPNNFGTIKNIAATGRGILCSSGTLCCYSEPHLRELFALCKELNLDIAFNEPNTVGEESLRHSLRRTVGSWYHPYLPILRELEYELPDNKGKQTRDQWGRYAEQRTFIFAKSGLETRNDPARIR